MSGCHPDDFSLIDLHGCHRLQGAVVTGIVGTVSRCDFLRSQWRVVGLCSGCWSTGWVRTRLLSEVCQVDHLCLHVSGGTGATFHTLTLAELLQ